MSVRWLVVRPLMVPRFSASAVVAVLLAGCGGEPYKIAPVSGRVTLNGQPLANAAVLFQPVATKDNANPGPGSGGITGADGRYALRLVGSNRDGAVVGKHKVQITMAGKDDPADDRPRKKSGPALPRRYHGKDTKLDCDVPAGGTDSADFALTSP
jgi:hypothetical protein